MSLYTAYSTEPFIWKGITIYQDDRVLKVGTDALLLATWVSTINQDPAAILDVGTGTGVLALVMAEVFQQAAITAIDPDENAVRLAQFNAGLSHYKNKILVDKTGLLEYADSADQTFDLILSNPPFYVNHILPADGFMKSAKHATSSPGKWMSALNKLVSDQGLVCLVLPTLVAFEWIREANSNFLYCNNRMDVFSFPGDTQSKRSLLCFSRALEKPKHAAMIMYAREKKYTAEYTSWLGI